MRFRINKMVKFTKRSYSSKRVKPIRRLTSTQVYRLATTKSAQRKAGFNV